MPIDRRVLENHARRLADRFYKEQDLLLIKELRARGVLQDSREALTAVSGITNPSVLDRLLDLQIGPETVASLALVPLIAVAWADGRVDEKEREAIFEAAAAAGFDTGRPDHPLLERWLSHPLDAALLEAWTLYVEGLCELMDAHEREALRHDLLKRARRVAEAAGGFLGLTSPVSHAERRMLDTLEAAFAGTTCADDDGKA